MKVRLHPALPEKVLTIAHEYGYAPEEVITMGLDLATVVLNEKERGNEVILLSPEGTRAGEFSAPEPRAIRETIEKYEPDVIGKPAAAASFTPDGAIEGPSMRLELPKHIDRRAQDLGKQHNYAPGEIISMSITMAKVMLNETVAKEGEDQERKNRIAIVSPEGEMIREFLPDSPKAIEEMAASYVRGISQEGESASDLVRRLEKERDEREGGEHRR